MLTDHYEGEAQFKGNCQMGTENFIQSKVRSPDGVKFKPETNIQVMDTISDANYSKFGQLQTNDICFPLNSAFWIKDEFNNKMLHSSQTENCPFTLGPTICVTLNQTFASNKTFISWTLINSNKRSAVCGSWNPSTSMLI